MNSKMTFFFILLLLISANSALAASLAPLEQRKKIYLERTGVKASIAYTKTLEWFAKSFTDSNSSIKMKDESSKKVIAKGALACEAVNIGNGYSKDQTLHFNLTFQAKDGRVRIAFEDLVGKADGGWDNGDRPSDKAGVAKVVKECLDPLKSKLIANIKITAKEEDW